MSSIPQVPVLSLSEYDGQKGGFTDALGQAWRETGFVGIRDHGVDDNIIERAYDAFKAFFALPLQAKLECEYRGHESNRGYIGCGKETHDHAFVADRKETYDINPEPVERPEWAQPWPKQVPESFQYDLTSISMSCINCINQFWCTLSEDSNCQPII